MVPNTQQELSKCLQNEWIGEKQKCGAQKGGLVLGRMQIAKEGRSQAERYKFKSWLSSQHP